MPTLRDRVGDDDSLKGWELIFIAALCWSSSTLSRSFFYPSLPALCWSLQGHHLGPLTNHLAIVLNRWGAPAGQTVRREALETSLWPELWPFLLCPTSSGMISCPFPVGPRRDADSWFLGVSPTTPCLSVEYPYLWNRPSLESLQFDPSGGEFYFLSDRLFVTTLPW